MWHVNRLLDIASKARRYREQIRYTHLPKFVNWLLARSLRTAQKKLLVLRDKRVLIDNSVFGNSITHETTWISTGTSLWAGQEVENGYMARVPVHSKESNPRLYNDVCYLPALAALARENSISLCTSPQLMHERRGHPGGRYEGYSYYDYNVFRGIKIEMIGRFDFQYYLANRNSSPPMPTENLGEADLSRYKGLVRVLGEKNNQDAMHIATCEANKIFCFLTMDYALKRILESQKDREVVASLTTRVMTPSELGKFLGLRPVSPTLLSYHEASYPVRTDISMPQGKRRPASAYRKKARD